MALVPLLKSVLRVVGVAFPGLHAWRFRHRPQSDFTIDEELVYVDFQAPDFEADAGSRTIYEFLKTLRERGTRVGIVAFGSPRSRPGLIAEYESRSIRVEYGSLSVVLEKLRALPEATIVVVKGPEVASCLLGFLRERGTRKILYYGSDIYHIRFARTSATQALVTRIQKWASAISFFVLERAIWKTGVDCLYPSDEEVAYVRKYARCARRMPIRFFPVEELQARAAGAHRKEGSTSGVLQLLFVGGANHYPNVDGLRWFADEVLPRLQALSSRTVRVAVAGRGWAGQGIQSPLLVFEGAVSDEVLESLYESADIVVAPLLEGAGVKGKVIEGLYHCRPVVTTTVGAQGILATAVVAVDSAGDFAKSIIEVSSDESRSSALIDNGMKHLVKAYSVHAIDDVMGDGFVKAT